MAETKAFIDGLREQLAGLELADETAYDPGLHQKAWRPFMDGMSDILRQLKEKTLSGNVRDRMNIAHGGVTQDPDWFNSNAELRKRVWAARRDELDAFLVETGE